MNLAKTPGIFAAHAPLPQVMRWVILLAGAARAAMGLAFAPQTIEALGDPCRSGRSAAIGFDECAGLHRGARAAPTGARWLATLVILSVFPNLVVQQIANTLAVRQQERPVGSDWI